MIDHTDYSKRRAVGTVEAHGIAFKIVRPVKKWQKGALVFTLDGRSVAICHPRDDVAVTPEFAKAHFLEKVAEHFKTADELRARLSWLNERGGADLH